MKALFLAGGKGSRLEPLTDNIPKPMIPIINKPLLERLFLKLKTIGIIEIVISCCYKSEYIIDYFGNGNHLGLNIEYIIEETPLGTGGAIKKSSLLLKETFIVFNSDIICDIDIKKMLILHKKTNSAITIATTRVENPSAYGLVESNSNGYATAFIEKPNSSQIQSNYINAGIYIIEPKIIKEIPSDTIVSIEKDFFPLMLNNGVKIAVFKNENYWIDIGTHEKYLQIHQDLLDGTCSYIDIDHTNNVSYGKNVDISNSASILGNVFIGNNVSIGSNTIISNTSIGNDVVIKSNCKIRDSVIWNNIQIYDNVNLFKSVIMSDSILRKNLNYINSVFSQHNQKIETHF